MGVIHKLKPEVLNFILENKKNNPSLSCRNLEQLVLEKLQVKVSKSSINAIFKENSLSMPIGRRQKEKKKKFNMPSLPVIEGSKAIAVIKEGDGSIFLESNARKVEPSPSLEEPVKEKIIEEKKEETSSEEKRLKEAEEWAMKLQEEERARVEEKLNLKEQKSEEEVEKKKTEENELKALLDEALRVKAAEEEAVLKAKAEEEEKKRQKEQAKKIEEEKAALEAELKAEREKWARLAEEELKARQQEEEKEKAKEKEEAAVVVKKEEPAITRSLPKDRSCSGAILLKALDCLIGAGYEINKLICNQMGNKPEDFSSLTEALIFRSLFENDDLSELWNLIGIQYPVEKLDNYYAQASKNKNIKSDIIKVISDFFTEARAIKLSFVDGNTVYFDGQLHSVWATHSLPYDFSSTVYNLKNNLDKYFVQDQPLILFSAYGNDIPSKDFFNLLLNISSKNNYPESLTLYGNKLEELDKTSLNQKKYSLVFGLWPWQFSACRKVKKIGDFDLKYVEEIDKDLYLAAIEIDLLRPSLNQSITLKGCAVKTDINEKIRLVIINFGENPMSLDKLAGTYLNHWPNFEEAFQDFSHKIELFAYVGNTQKFFSKDNFIADMSNPDLELGEVFANYIKMLDAYLRWHFLPVSYREKDISFASRYFYKLQVKLTANQFKVVAQIQHNQDYQFLKDLEYLICRLNECKINLANGARLCFGSAFK